MTTGGHRSARKNCGMDKRWKRTTIGRSREISRPERATALRYRSAAGCWRASDFSMRNSLASTAGLA